MKDDIFKFLRGGKTTRLRKINRKAMIKTMAF
jgi:hypothetical protein